ncbi:hypothetical protein SCHPADRAFT_897196 [Schizopora paradoxa]|uniref:Secreted protein n=1 Tax=Schizopora paradoxa TaxID=27342 RepID=A0A0H2QXW5_9AGAM|nr:hypothetical protein SCHPADRAFT_897196 [Schizopora paradoxa]
MRLGWLASLTLQWLWLARCGEIEIEIARLVQNQMNEPKKCDGLRLARVKLSSGWFVAGRWGGENDGVVSDRPWAMQYGDDRIRQRRTDSADDDDSEREGGVGTIPRQNIGSMCLVSRLVKGEAKSACRHLGGKEGG